MKIRYLVGAIFGFVATVCAQDTIVNKRYPFFKEGIVLMSTYECTVDDKVAVGRCYFYKPKNENVVLYNLKELDGLSNALQIEFKDKKVDERTLQDLVPFICDTILGERGFVINENYIKYFKPIDYASYDMIVDVLNKLVGSSYVKIVEAKWEIHFYTIIESMNGAKLYEWTIRGGMSPFNLDDFRGARYATKYPILIEPRAR